MRKLKFKVWDRENEEMYFTNISNNVESSNSIMECRICLDELGWNVAVRDFNEGEFTEVEDFELLEYTGFKDKNDKEIYEGDIIEGGYQNPLTSEFDSRKYLIVYEKGTFVGKLIGHSPYGDTWLQFISGEVIGNKFEDAELVKCEGNI